MSTLAIRKAAALSGEQAAAELKKLASRLPDRSLRRAPRLAQMALCAALEAGGGSPPPEALVIATAYASVANTFEFMDSILGDGAALASPTAFSHSVTNMGAALVGQYLRITGPSLTVTQPELSPALEAAAALLATDQAGEVLLGIISEHSSAMREIENIAGREETAAEDGAAFFRLSRPDPGRREWLLDFGRDPGASAAPAGLLPTARRLAETCLGPGSEARAITNGREFFVIRRGGGA